MVYCRCIVGNPKVQALSAESSMCSGAKMRSLFILLFTFWVCAAETQSCVTPEKKCNFICDCPDCEDELDCGFAGQTFGCDFEQGACGWTDGSLNTSYTWERRQRGDAFTDTGPSSDFTVGTADGWFMAVTAVSTEGVSRAVLVSPELKPSAPTCRVSLRYFLWDSGLTGLGPAPLWASVRYPGEEEEALLWRPEPSSVRGWREATVFVGRTHSSFRLVFQSERRDGGSADVALDHLQFQDCALPNPFQTSCVDGSFSCSDGSCVEPKFVCDGTSDCGDSSDEDDCEDFHRCDFNDEDLCEMWDLRSVSPLKWIRTNQKNLSSSDPRIGPGRDHSNNSASGHFLYVTVPESGLTRDWAAFQTKLLDPTKSSHPCKMVFYSHQFGPRSGGLTVLVAGLSISPVWERGGALGDLWVRAEVQVVANTTYQILIMAAIRDLEYGGIGVDSIVLSPECRLSEGNWTVPKKPQSPPNPCTSPEKMCDFQTDCSGAMDENMCGDFQYPDGHKGWTDSSVGGQGWTRHQDATSKEVHLYVAAAAGRLQTPAQMRTPLLGPSGPACSLSFDYALTGPSPHIGSLSLSVMDSELGPQPKLWEFNGKTGTDPEIWNSTEVHIGQRTSRFQLVFEGEAADTQAPAEIKVTNILFHGCSRNYFPFFPTGASCNFEEGLCNWFQDNSDNFDWTLQHGEDHTVGQGRSVVVDFWSQSLRGASGRLLSYKQPPSSNGKSLCFFYKLSGPNTGALNVKLEDLFGYELTLWSHTGAHGNMWHEAQCPVPPQYAPYRLVLEAVRSGFDGHVAVDDVVLRDGPCSSLQRMCSFEGSQCDFSSSGAVRWSLTSGHRSPAGPDRDHTLDTETGHYMLLNSSSDLLPEGASSSFTSPLILGKSHSKCLHFWYHMDGVSPGSLTAYMKPVGGERVQIFSNSLPQGQVWRQGSGDVSPDLKDWQLEFEVVGAGGKNTHVAIDDIHLSADVCEPQNAMCTLEKGLCSWSNTQDLHKDQLDWELSSREAETHYSVPEADHTLGNDKGHFLFLPSSNRTAANQTAWLLSPYLPPTKGTCLKLWANMPFSDLSELRLLLRSEGEQTQILSTSQTGGTWKYFDITINSTDQYQIVLEGIKGSSGFLALDDIEVTVGVDCTGRDTDTNKGGPQDVGGIVAAVLVVLLLVATLTALFIFYLRSNRRRGPMSAVGFSNQSYDNDLTEDYVSFPPAVDHQRAADFTHFSDSVALD